MMHGKRMKLAAVVVAVVLMGVAALEAADREILGVRFPGEITLEGKRLILNGVAYRKALGFIKVYAGAFYLEKPTRDPREAIDSEQVKHFHLQYLTEQATAKKLQEGFIELMEKTNPAEQVAAHKAQILQHAAWMDKDMAPGKSSKTTYIPGQGLRVEYQGEVKGTIADPEYVRMYYRYIFGEQADAEIRKGFLGIE
jgi:hypothetical protein